MEEVIETLIDREPHSTHQKKKGNTPQPHFGHLGGWLVGFTSLTNAWCPCRRMGLVDKEIVQANVSLQDHTLVGRPDAPTQQDIQLSGLGIQPEHAVVEMENNDVYITPLDGARTCVNGSVIHEKRRVRHGDRILWGNNHFFRLNCPRLANSPSSQEPEQKIDYDFAQQELMEKELVNDPIQEAIGAIEKQHEEDKQGERTAPATSQSSLSQAHKALEKQRQMYEKQMQMLRNQLMSPGTPSFPLQLFDASKLTPTGSQNSIQKKYQQWAQER
ncbi:kinesin-like protein kif13a [Bulinus truncatus]|nr:kinesin-like protein kif13a [Bulinus truncatus]